MHLAIPICACLLVFFSAMDTTLVSTSGMFPSPRVCASANHRTIFYDNHEEGGKGYMCQISDKTRNSRSNKKIFLLAFTKAHFTFVKSHFSLDCY